MADHLAHLTEALASIDPAKLPHGLEQYKRFGPHTVRAILAVRDLIFYAEEWRDTQFRIGLTSDPAAQQAIEQRAGCVKFATVFTSTDLEEARTVEADVRLNFLWHFPGRCLNKGDYRQEPIAPDSPACVYLACFPPATFRLLGKA